MQANGGEHEENEKHPFQINSGEMMRVFICTSDDKIRLLIMAHHLVGDGKSITYFIEDVMRALSGEVLFIPPVVSYAKHIIGVVTMEDGMRISYHYMDRENDVEEQKFFAEAIGYMRDEKNI